MRDLIDECYFLHLSIKISTAHGHFNPSKMRKCINFGFLRAVNKSDTVWQFYSFPTIWQILWSQVTEDVFPLKLSLWLIQDRRKLYEGTKKLVYLTVWLVCEHLFMWSKNKIHLVLLKVGVHTLQMIVLQQITSCIY